MNDAQFKAREIMYGFFFPKVLNCENINPSEKTARTSRMKSPVGCIREQKTVSDKADSTTKGLVMTLTKITVKILLNDLAPATTPSNGSVIKTTARLRARIAKIHIFKSRPLLLRFLKAINL